ncbi:MAG: hypothetical protein MJ252_20985 [archaeon]|nr:hypothetical protein [archaeon]
MSGIESVGVHPLAVVTISDHYNRMRINTNNQNIRVYGALMGIRHQTHVEVFSTFEFENTSKDPKKCEFDKKYIDTRRELATQLYPKYDIVGFYSTNNSSLPAKEDQEILDTLLFFGIISPIYAILNTASQNNERLPLTVYELDKLSKDNVFKELGYNIESMESERICLDTVTKAASFNEEKSGLVQNFTIFKNAAGMLKENLNLILTHMDKYKDDPVFQAGLNDILWNIPKAQFSDYFDVMGEKKKEILIFNNICAGVIENSYQGRNNQIEKQFGKDNDKGDFDEMGMDYH